jgi:hypothetical protein
MFEVQVAILPFLVEGLMATASSKFVILTLSMIILVPLGSMPSVLKGKAGTLMFDPEP